MGDLEHEFIKATHYEPALKDITNAEFKKKIMGSKAFQNVLWSTAVQHGASGAAKIFNSAYSPELSDEGIIRRIYKIRATRFGSSDYRTRRSVFRRFDEEREIALAAVKKTDTIRQDIGTSTMVADASPEVSGIPSEQPSGTQVPNSAMAARNLADTEKRQQQVVASAKQEQPAINVSTEPDKKQHTLIAEQTDVMRDVADNIAKMNDQLKKSFGNGEVFRSMDGKLASLNDKDPVVVSAAPNVAQLPPRRQQTQPKGIDLSKQYREGA